MSVAVRGQQRIDHRSLALVERRAEMRHFCHCPRDLLRCRDSCPAAVAAFQYFKLYIRSRGDYVIPIEPIGKPAVHEIAGCETHYKSVNGHSGWKENEYETNFQRLDRGDLARRRRHGVRIKPSRGSGDPERALRR